MAKLKDPVKFVKGMLDYDTNIGFIRDEVSEWDLPDNVLSKLGDANYDEIQSMIGDEWTYLSRYFTIATADAESGGALELAIYYVLTNIDNEFSTVITNHRSIFSCIGESTSEFECDGITLASNVNCGYYQIGCLPSNVDKVIELVEKHKDEIIKLSNEIVNNSDKYGYCEDNEEDN